MVIFSQLSKHLHHTLKEMKKEFNKKKIGFLILIGLTLFFLSWLIYFIWHRHVYAVTDAVFVQAENLVYVSFPKVNGMIIKLHKGEGDQVKKGEILAEIADHDYALKVAQLEKQLKELEAQKRSLIYQIEKTEDQINLEIARLKTLREQLVEQESAQVYNIKQLETKLKQVKTDRSRYELLYKEGLVSAHDLETLETMEKELEAQISAAKATLSSIKKAQEEIEKRIKLTLNEQKTVLSQKSQLLSLEARKEGLNKQKEEALVYYNYTKLVSPIDGVIAKKFHSVGDVIGPGEPIYAIVDPDSFYVLVLLEETKLRGVKKGCPVKIRIDAYPNERFEGVVDEILPASAATFALVPRDISAGEFTKLAQRIFVKIRITKGNKNILKVGLGGEVEIKRQ